MCADSTAEDSITHDTGFPTGPRKWFAGDLQLLATLLREQRPFAFSRFGDGEWHVLCREKIDITAKGHGEFRFDPNDPADQQARSLLIDSFHYLAENYFIGIGCPCCWGRAKLLQLRSVCQQPEHALTWANIWGNANYPIVRSGIVPYFRAFGRVILVCHRRGMPDRLPFPVTKTIRVGTNAWTRDLRMADQMTDLAAESDEQLFLFCAGPLSNILCHRGHRVNPRNTYLDLGSVLDPWLFSRKHFRWMDRLSWLIPSPGVTRGYLKPGQKRKQVCQWWIPTDEELARLALSLPGDLHPRMRHRAA